MTTPAARKPRPADVARWVAVLAQPEPSRLRFGGAALRELMAPRKRARSALLSFGLGDDGLPLAKAAPAAPVATGPTHRPETPRNRLVRQAREALRVALYFGDQMGISSARAQLAALGVDEAGDDVVAAPAVEVST